jgi:hypothetical protein
MPLRHYILDGKTPVEEPDFLIWSEWFMTTDRTVRRSLGWEVGEGIEGVEVSTVFLGMDHNFWDEGPPLLFETMVFGGPLDSRLTRCSTWEEAEDQHRVMMMEVSAMAKNLTFAS